jgi:hypothetical protein
MLSWKIKKKNEPREINNWLLQSSHGLWMLGERTANLLVLDSSVYALHILALWPEILILCTSFIFLYSKKYDGSTPAIFVRKNIVSEGWKI